MSIYGENASISGSLIVTGSATFNDQSKDVDFAVESDNQTHMLFVDAGNDRVGVATNSPQATFHIKPSSGDTSVIFEGVQDVSLGLVADTDNSGGEDQNPSFFMTRNGHFTESIMRNFFKQRRTHHTNILRL